MRADPPQSAERDAIVAAAAKLSGYLVNLTAELVALPTPNPPGEGYARCVDYLVAELDRIGLRPTVIPVPGGGDHPRACILAALGDGADGDGDVPTLHFHGHYDVVPAAAPEDYEPRIADGRLYGRGSSDMKSGLAAMLGALRILRDLGHPRRGRVLLSLVPDEETGGQLGTEYLWRSGHLRPGAVGMLMPEPTSGAVWNANRGALSLGITVRGKPAHVGLAHAGSNAFAGMVSIARALLALREKVARHETGLAIDPPEARRSVLLVGGQCRGGVNFNVVPEECWFTVDRRPNPEEDLAEARAELLATIEVATPADLRVEWSVIQSGEPAATPTDTPLARALAAAIGAVERRAPRFAMCPGLVEIRFFIRQGVPALAYGPGILSVSHGPAEYVELSRTEECAAVYALAARALLGS